jgi:hypothetical protein
VQDAAGAKNLPSIATSTQKAAPQIGMVSKLFVQAGLDALSIKSPQGESKRRPLFYPSEKA